MQDNKRTVLYIGPLKSGKTFHALTWPDPYVIYFDKNDDTLLSVPGIKYDTPDTIAQTKLIIRELEKRELKAETIVLDTSSALAQLVRAEIQGPNPKMAIAAWGTMFDTLLEIHTKLVSLARPKTKGGKAYHVVCTTHERPENDDEGGILQYAPAIQGQFKEWLGRLFNTVLLTDVDLVSKTTKGPDGKPVVNKTTSYFVHTVPPNRFWKIGGGFAKNLPPKCGGDYATLSQAWLTKENS